MNSPETNYSIDRPLEDDLKHYYSDYFWCHNCHHEHHVWIRKGTTMREVWEKLVCSNCGCKVKA
jgi:transcription elongation factor Elf1